jgi:hypothetical protein
MSLKKIRKETLPSTLTVIGQGDSISFKITYHNRKQSEVEAVMNAPIPDGADPVEAMTSNIEKCILFVVESWDAEYELSPEGLRELEDDRPGMKVALIEGYHKARSMARAKN